MAVNCDAVRTNLALQTPVYDELFMDDWAPLDAPLVGRHETEAWKEGTGDTHFFDRVRIGQPDMTGPWQRINAAECQDACDPPRTMVAFGTDRDSYFPEQRVLVSQPFCLNQLRYQTKVSEQISAIYKGLKMIPLMYLNDFIQVHAFDFNPTVQIASMPSFPTFTPTPLNTTSGLTTIDLGGAGNLPTSELTFQYLDYITSTLGLEGYARESGLPDGLFNLITHSRVWHKLVYANPDVRDLIRITNAEQASPLFKLGAGVSTRPFGNYAPTFNETQIRFQHMGNGILNRVFPYLNVAATTGTKRIPNPAWINANVGLSFLWHPKAIKIWTPLFKRIHEMVPSLNTAMFGKWKFINNQGDITLLEPDGTTCVKNNDLQLWFYWLVQLEQGFQYKRPELLMPILHLLDGSGKACSTDSPICGDLAQYVAQTTSDDPIVCET